MLRRLRGGKEDQQSEGRGGIEHNGGELQKVEE